MLSDTNPHLIELYRELSQRRDEFIGVAQTFFDEKYRSSEAYTEVARRSIKVAIRRPKQPGSYTSINSVSTGYVGTTNLARSMFHRWPRSRDRGHCNARETNGRGALLRHQPVFVTACCFARLNGNKSLMSSPVSTLRQLGEDRE